MQEVKYKDILSIDKIIKVYHKIMISTKHRNKIFDFNMFYMSNIINIYNSLLNKDYVHGKYNIFLIHEPKCRVIMSEKLRDKIVNHLVSDYLLVPLIDNRLLDFNVATRRGKGSSKAYFYNIDHEILFKKLNKILKDEDVFMIIKKIVCSTDLKYINEEIKQISYKYNVNIPFYNQGKVFLLEIKQAKYWLFFI